MSADPWNDDAQLAAYLAGELDEVTARRVDERLAQDPALGERLDRIHDALLAVRQPDRVTVPKGLEGRLAARLEQEWSRAAAGSDSSAGAAAAASAVGPAAASAVGPQADATDPQAAAGEGTGSEQAPHAGGEATQPWHRRLLGGAGASPNRWQVPVGAAAAVVLVAVAAATMLPLGHSGDEAADSDALRTTQADSPERAAPEEDAADDDVAEELGSAEEGRPDADADLDTFQESAPGEAEDAEDPGAETFDAPIARADAPAAADRRWEALPGRQSACRQDVEGASPEPVVPLDVHESRSAGRTVFVFEIATAREGGDTLDRTAHVTVDSATCEVIEYSQR